MVVADSTGCNGSASRLTRRTRLSLSTYRKHREREEDKRRPRFSNSLYFYFSFPSFFLYRFFSVISPFLSRFRWLPLSFLFHYDIVRLVSLVFTFLKLKSQRHIIFALCSRDLARGSREFLLLRHRSNERPRYFDLPSLSVSRTSSQESLDHRTFL